MSLKGGSTVLLLNLLISCQIFVVDSICEQEKSSGSYSAKEMSVYLRSCVHKQVKTNLKQFTLKLI